MIAAYMGIATRMKGRIGVHVTVNDLAVLVNGTVHGDGERAIGAAKPVPDAGPRDVTFVENERNVRLLGTCRAAAVVAPASLAARISKLSSVDGIEFTVVQVNDALTGFAAIMHKLHGQPDPPPHGIDPRAFVHPTAQIGADASILPFATVGEGSVIGARCRLFSGVAVGRNCRLGDDVVLYPHAVLYDNTVLGDRVILHAHAVLGADGFGYRMQDGKHVKSPQFGWVELGDDVEVGAGSTIDRGAFQPTRIGAGTKIDNLVQIGHNCQVGRHNLLVSQVGMAGSCSTGDYVVVAGQAGVADHIHIGAGAIIGARSAVSREVPPGVRFLGVPARPEGEQKRILVSLDRLPAVCRDVRRIKRQLGIPDET
jgi:UDP-3-O-[3-hydroxymyristoyl] glucosamine N-acyltransferase